MVSPYVARRHGEEPTTYAHPSLEAGARRDPRRDRLPRAGDGGARGADRLRPRLRRPAAPAARPTSASCPRSAGGCWPGPPTGGQPRTPSGSGTSWPRSPRSGSARPTRRRSRCPTERSAFLKAHVFPEFMAGLLTHDPGMYPRRMILDECRLFGVAVLPPDVNRSVAPYSVEVVDRGLADHLLGLTAAVRAVQRGEDPIPAAAAAARVAVGLAGGAGRRRRSAARPADRVRRRRGRGRLPLRRADRAAGRRRHHRRRGGALLAGRPFTSLRTCASGAGCRGPTAEALTDAGRAGPARRGRTARWSVGRRALTAGGRGAVARPRGRRRGGGGGAAPGAGHGGCRPGGPRGRADRAGPARRPHPGAARRP
jgi:hypothetical protein